MTIMYSVMTQKPSGSGWLSKTIVTVGSRERAETVATRLRAIYGDERVYVKDIDV
jgi:hypothetical protein